MNEKLKEALKKQKEESEKYEKEYPEETIIYYIPGCSGADHDTRIDYAQKISIDEAKQMLSERPIHGLTLYRFTEASCIAIAFDEYDAMYIPLYLIQKGRFKLW